MSDPFPPSAKAVAYLGQRRVQYMDWPVDDRPLAEHEVAGRTLVSLISPGTETSCPGFHLAAERPWVGGYAAVFEIAAVGAAVRGWAVGQRALCLGPHVSWQRRAEPDLIAVPGGLPVEQAPFARLMGVGWSTLTTTTARPPDRVLVLGLGLVGNLAAQLFQAAGYVVTGVDPNASRRQLAERCGIGDVRPAAAGQGDLVDRVALALECSGHEQAVLDACGLVRRRGEVVLVGVPWKKRSDVLAFDVLHAVFHRYVVLRSGWEWEVPRHPRDFAVGSIADNLAGAMRWLSEKRVSVQGLYRMVSPRAAQEAYDDLLNQRGEYLSAVFDWRGKGT